MFTFEIVNPPTSFSLEKKTVKNIFSSVKKEVPIKQKGVINIAFLSDEQVQNYNKIYRSIDSTTDVLSFHYFEDFSPLGKHDIAGEIILSESKVIKQAGEHRHESEEESSILILHGVLHILGFDHETDEEYEDMWKYELSLREKLGLSLDR